MRRSIVLLALVLAACTPNVQIGTEDLPSSSSSSSAEEITGLHIRDVTAGTKRTEEGLIAVPTTTFAASDHFLVFNVDLGGVAKETKVTAHWKLEGDSGPFSEFSVTATPEQTLAKFHLEKDSNWPDGTYTMYIDALNTDEEAFHEFEYTIAK